VDLLRKTKRARKVVLVEDLAEGDLPKVEKMEIRKRLRANPFR